MKHPDTSLKQIDKPLNWEVPIFERSNDHKEIDHHYFTITNITMKTFKILFLSLLIISIMSCSKEEEPVNQITMADFIGTWQATSAIFTNNGNTSQKFSFIENGGEIRFTILAGGKVRTWITLGTFNDEWDALATLQGDMIISTPAESSRSIITRKWSLNGNILTLTNENDKFDFTLQGGSGVSATSVIVLQKQ